MPRAALWSRPQAVVVQKVHAAERVEEEALRQRAALRLQVGLNARVEWGEGERGREGRGVDACAWGDRGAEG